MKPIIILSSVLITVAGVYAQEATLEQIIKGRDDLLTKIHETMKKSFDAGVASEEDVYRAILELYSFRRDTSKALAERLQWQEQIVTSEKQRKAVVEKRLKQGTTTPVDGLRASERLLAAEQKLLELKSEK